jgi:hypothetical protein
MNRRANSKRTSKAAVPHTSRADREVLLALTAELYQTLAAALERIGISRRDRRDAQQRRRTRNTQQRKSEVVLQEVTGIADLLARWKNVDKYSDPNGNPKPLAIRGPGVSFERLAKQAMPGTPLRRAIELVCRTGQVIKGKSENLVFVGSPVVKMPNNRETVLAGLVRTVRAVSSTVSYNSRLRPEERGTGRFERFAWDQLSDKQFAAFLKAVRPDLEDLVERQNARLVRENSKPSKGKKALSGLFISVFRDDEESE